MGIDVWLLLITVGALFVVGIPVIRATVSLPSRLEYQDVPDAELNDRQRRFFERYDHDLDSLGFEVVRTFRVVNLQGFNLNRLYRSRNDSTLAMATALRSHVEESPGAQNYLEFIDDFRDGTILTTRNTQLPSLFPPLPGQVVQERWRVQSTRELKREHDTRRASIPSPPNHRASLEEIFERQDQEHLRFCQVHAEGGLLHSDPSRATYRATTRLALKGIASYLNPIDREFRVWRLLVGVLLGSGLPMTGLQLGQELSLPGWGSDVPILAFTLAGAAIGSVFSGKHIFWSFLLGYLPVRMAGGLGVPTLLGTLVMGAVSTWIDQWRERRRVIA